ncbi:MAG: hypothetical protein COC24_018210 [Alphaproteobacteria bacterium]|nr:hypothetical protein [Alphaproteobacteria bacterium]
MKSVGVNVLNDGLGLVAGGAELVEITMSDLLIWAIRDERVMEWIDAEHDGVGGMKSQLGALIAQCEIGGRVDGGGGVSSDRMPYDAMRVGFAVQGLGVDAKRLVLDCARNGDKPYRIRQTWRHVNAKGRPMPVMYDKFGKRKIVSYGRDENGKRIRLKVCHIAPAFTDADRDYFKPMFDDWMKSLKLLTKQLSDLERFIIV